MRIVILAGGAQERWREGVAFEQDGRTGRLRSKHPNKLLVPVPGRPLLARTLAQLEQRGHAATLFTRDPALEGLAPWLDAPPVADVVDAVSALADSGELVLLLGDVCFGAAGLDQVLAPDVGAWRLYGRLGPNPHTRKAYPEIFALRIGPGGAAAVLAATKAVPAAASRRKLWELYRALRGDPVPAEPDPTYLFQPPPDPRFTTMADWTDDVDFPQDHAELLRLFREKPEFGAL